MDINQLLQALSSGKKEHVLEALHRNVPQKLYKYVWLDGSENDKLKFNSLENNTLWISGIEMFNDPFEFKGLTIDKAKFETKGFSKDVINAYADCLDFSHEYGVCCLSNVPVDYLPMWAYYTNNHRGFCIEYEVLKNDYIFEVMYEPKRYSVFSSILQLASELQKLVKHDRSFDERKALELGYMFLFNMLIKSDNWAHEHEFRILYNMDLRNKKGDNISLDTLGLKTTMIIGGYKCNPDNLNNLNRISQKLIGDSAYQVIMSDTEFTTIEKKIH